MAENYSNEEIDTNNTSNTSQGVTILGFGLGCVFPLSVVLFVIFFIFSACSNLSVPDTVPNDWDADGDSFDDDDLDSYFEYKENH